MRGTRKGSRLSVVTEENKEIFIGVVAWLLIAWGVHGVYYSITQSLLGLAFSKEAFALDLESAMPFFTTSLNVFFGIAAIWLGFGLLQRKETVLRSFPVVGWLYIVIWSATTIFAFGIGIYATSPSPAEAPSAEVVEAFKEARTVHLAYSARGGIALLAESALIIWVLANLKTDVIRQGFASE